MLAVSHLTKTFNLQTLFIDISFLINPTERVGLIGPNGCGKTTLLRILVGKEEADSGQVHKPTGLRIGYLTQGFPFPSEQTVSNVIADTVGDVNRLSVQLVEVSQKLTDRPDDPKLIGVYTDLLRSIQNAESGRVEKYLSNLGLQDIPLDMPVGILSGGQKTRLSLALLLMNDPEILLLDEPTNHLDIEMLEWLEEWLQNASCGALIVSHDRMFLDRTVTRILELDAVQHSLRSYAGNYSAYVEQKEKEIESQWSAYRDQQIEVRRMKVDIARAKEQAKYTERQASSIRIGGSDMKIKGFKTYQQSIAKKVAKKAKAREKRLERYEESDDRVEKPKGARTIRVEFEPSAHLGSSVIQMERLNIGFPGIPPLLENINLQVRAGQRIALTGPNGSGKTTLLRTLYGEIKPLAGKFILGSSVHLGLMSQELNDLAPEKNAVEHMWEYFPNQTEARRFLGYYLLTGDEVLKQASLLSYGQRTRLMLAKLVVSGCNVLLLDEPINHLDISSRTQFEQALKPFSGTILMVVHDRYFIQRFAQEIWQVRGRRLVVSSSGLGALV